MLTYIIQRLLYAIPVIILVALVTFILFFMFVPPEVMAKQHLSAKAPTPEDIQNWLEKHSYDKPLFINTRPGSDGKMRLWDSQFFKHLRSIFLFDFGKSDQTGERISKVLLERMGPSLALTIPAFILSLFLNTALSLYVAYFRGTYVDRWALVACVLLMAVPILIWIIAGQWAVSLVMQLTPVSGWDVGTYGVKFLYLPIILTLVAGVGGSVRFYRTVMLEEISKDYVRTARSKGMSESRVLFRDVLKNSMIPILTSAVMAIPFLFMGSLLLENFFGIPGLGAYMIERIHASDFAAIRALVFIGTALYILGLLLTDVSYTLVNPRIRFQGIPLMRMGLPVIICAVLVGCAGAVGRLGMMLSQHAEQAEWKLQQPWILENTFVFLIIAFGIYLLYQASQREYWREAYRRVTQNKLAIPTLAVVAIYTLAAVLDSISWKTAKSDLRPLTLLDRLFEVNSYFVKQESFRNPLAGEFDRSIEKTISEGKLVEVIRESEVAGDSVMVRLAEGKAGGRRLLLPVSNWDGEKKRVRLEGAPPAGAAAELIMAVPKGWRRVRLKFLPLYAHQEAPWACVAPDQIKAKRYIPVERTYSAPFAQTEYKERKPKPIKYWPHLFGTDSNGEDVLYKTLKGARTALIIGVFSTLIVIPIAAVMGIMAGYFRGWVDDTVQLLYTMLASIPSILLIVALMIVLGRGIPQLCFALGVTSWVGLCRVLRGETLKLRDLEYIQGAQALGISTMKVMWRHLLPNVMHIIIITCVLRFSGLVISEITLSYIGIGVAPGTGSWGLMIDGARPELARDPIVWWNITSAFVAMFILLLSFNYFGDVLRDALDPRLRDR